jgi:hypothetical protein
VAGLDRQHDRGGDPVVRVVQRVKLQTLTGLCSGSVSV